MPVKEGVNRTIDIGDYCAVASICEVRGLDMVTERGGER
jgi:hypothetical protein